MSEESSNTFVLLVDEPGIRLDRYVTDQFPDLSRTRVQKLIEDGHIRINDGIVKPGVKLNTEDRITVNLPPPPQSSLEPEEIPLHILYEDNDLLVIDKPAGLTVHPAPGHPEHTLVNAVLAHFSHLPDTGDSQRPGIVHRLDKDTSGVMLVAKTATGHENLTDQFKSRSITKVYTVLVKGHLTPEDGIIEAPIGRDPRRRQRMAVVGESRGREARTAYHVIEYIGEYTLLEVKPETGRTHQIRVHLDAIGYPVAGDKVYGGKSAHLSRQFVHASRLGFTLPSTGDYVEFSAPLPADLEKALKVITEEER
ncbi:RluA family pseudouridine synthase [Chloroflexota bacterium]